MTLLENDLTKDHQSRAKIWFKDLRDQICSAFEKLEDDLTGTNSEQPPGRFERTEWHRHDDPENGGGVMSVMKGRVFEKVGVNISTVYGEFPPEFAKSMPGADKDPCFWASGISLVAHMHNPLVPAVHMNTRHIITAKDWFGGGGDLNAAFPDDQDTSDFHNSYKAACDKYDPEFYAKYKKWCDEYFYIKHRNRARGEGGIFYDQLNTGNWENDFAFTQDVGRAFLDIYPELVNRNMNKEWTPEQREELLYYRGYYAEFNLVYDRGTTFGLKTGGNVDAILMSLPPEAKWR
ncbi:MAG: oxygen-dependent coproporphyrinogen oxidase [Emcibacter sp.]|nr:oxygen-dependent coproporphyrinogen oxidase [Emcibacter sp.]